MPLYFLVHDAATFEGAIAPALTAAWRARSFSPCRDLCARLVPAARAYAARYHTGPDEPLLCRVAAAGGAVPFGREMWRFLVGEILLYAAADIPEFQTAPETLTRLLAPQAPPADTGPRHRIAPIQQAHYGSRDLAFGGLYRPGEAGLNNPADVVRLAGYLTAVDPGRWSPADLIGLPGLDEEAERMEELAYAAERLASLRALYEGAARQQQVVVCEEL